MLNWFRGEEPKPPRGDAPVILHIYDLVSALAGPNIVAKAVGTGAYHAGVEVYGREWSFSCVSDGPYRSGIFWVPPRGCVAHVYREPVMMGRTTKTEAEVKALIERLYKEWPGTDYDLLRHNCCHFSDALCIELGVGPIPPWVTSLAGVGAMLRSGIRYVGEGVVAAPNLFQAAGQALGALMAGPAEGQKPVHPQHHASRMERRGTENGLPTMTAGAYTVGDHIEIWSNSYQAWCPGVVDSISAEGFVIANFLVPLPEPNNRANKALPPTHPHLRKAQMALPGPVVEKTPSPAAEAQKKKYSKGDAVEVWSNSSKAWCAGYISGIGDGMLSLAFRLPNAGPEEWSQKQLPIDHKGVRLLTDTPSDRPKSAGEATPSAPRKPSKTTQQALDRALESGSIEVLEKACSDAEAQGVDPADIEHVRRKFAIAAAKEELKYAVESKDPTWIDQAAKRARDAGVPAAEIAPAKKESRKLFARADLAAAIAVADEDLVEEVIAAGKAVGLGDEELQLARQQAKEAREREAQRAAHKVPKPDAGGPAPFDTAAESAASTDASSGGGVPPAVPSTAILLPSVGDWIEVYSNTHKDWFLGRITKVTHEGPTVVFQLPGAAPDDWLEKLVPTAMARTVLRRPALLASLAAEPPRAAADVLQLTAEESSTYESAFDMLFERAPGTNGGLATNAAADYLKGSGLPRKVLKQIWHVGKPNNQADLTFHEFAACIRLVGHCQCLLSSGDCGVAELLVDGGGALKALLEDDFVHKPPPVLARFHGQTLDEL